MSGVANSLLLGIVQGLTEFLPVSSSGHLILMREALGLNVRSGLAFDAILQLGTVLAVFVYFRRTVWNLVRDAVKLSTGRAGSVKPADRTLLLSLIVGTIPGVALGLLLEETMETTFRNPLLVAAMLVAGSGLFLFAERRAKQTKTATSVRDAWKIGWFQTLALIPGMSRSGSTISGGLLTGLTREAAARYSFLLSLPIITGSGLKKLLDVVSEGASGSQATDLLVGFVAAFVVGLACISFLLRYLRTHTLALFIWYRVALAAVVVLVTRPWGG